MLFARFDAAAQRVQEQVFGEEFAHHPRRRALDVNAGFESDPSRAVAVVTGIYTDRESPPALSNLPDGNANRRPGYSSRVLKIELRDAVAEARVGDVFERLADGRRFQVTSTSSDDMGRNHLTVTAL